MSRYETYLREHRDRHLAELKDFLRIPSVSALSAHRPDVERAARWVADAMQAAGLEHVEVLPTGGHPVVYADWLHAPGRPTALVYGHYDVQPVDPEHLWVTPPFEPDVRDGKLYARGASDDKGQVFLHIKAVETLLRVDGALPLNLRFLVEGEEEIGSRHLPAFVEAHRDRLRADVAVISDTTFFARGVPAITTGLRGLAALEITVRGARGDLHSGLYGGAVQNPLHALVELLAGLRGPDGRIRVEGFYDRVRPVPEEERRQWAALPHDDARLVAELGVPALFGEAGYTTLERLWARPTLELNGVWGGFTGEGTKTVLPAEAHAKITCRLVPDQEPEEILDRLEAHLRTHLPPGVTLEVRREPGGARAVLTPHDHPAVQAARQALREAYGVEPVLVRMGGSIPVAETFATVLGLPVVLLGFGLPEENFHAPNEHFHLENFDGGLRTLCAYWPLLARGAL
ncbi:dipeptidase [Caldinitratiruptor microaerophilus]|uniref:Peptidase M20 n=1 Tax=Caldinitratiruptor microaerophilus TaxID=671077 RepID=A0AA35CK08_9FIRM|nr:dipeptidase [Caldinitratiruptor microaerophilus]BDG60734.1 peptidase M20 [Caldinitratiruptor microaerophilus]